MKKKLAFMILAVLILSVLIILYVLGNSKDNKALEDTSESLNSDDIYVTDIKNTTEISISNDTDSFILKLNNDNYTVSGYENNTISQSDIKYVFLSFSKLKCVDIVEENAENLAKYGLDTPKAKVSIKGDSSINIFFGNLTADNKYRYVTVDNKKIYIINASVSNFAFSQVKSFISSVVTTIEAKNVNYVNIKTQNQPEILIENDENNEVLKNYTSTSGLSALLMKSPIKDAIVYPTNMQEFVLGDLSQISISDVAELNLDNLSKYGLDNPKDIITIKDSSKTLTLKKGNDKDENSVYVLIDDRPEVYVMTKDSFNLFESVNIMDFIQTFVRLYSRSLVDGIDYKTPRGSYKIEMRTEGDNKIAVDSEGVKRDNRNDYIDDILIDKESFGDFYELLSGISFDSIKYNEEKNNSSPLYTITYNLSEGKADKVEFYEYNNSFCYILQNNNLLLVNKEQLNSLEDKINELKK
ncbi:MAG: DUF4340 domain-containing protein [Lachnospirales bacterium]